MKLLRFKYHMQGRTEFTTVSIISQQFFTVWHQMANWNEQMHEFVHDNETSAEFLHLLMRREKQLHYEQYPSLQCGNILLVIQQKQVNPVG